MTNNVRNNVWKEYTQEYFKNGTTRKFPYPVTQNELSYILFNSLLTPKQKSNVLNSLRTRNFIPVSKMWLRTNNGYPTRTHNYYSQLDRKPNDMLALQLFNYISEIPVIPKAKKQTAMNSILAIKNGFKKTSRGNVSKYDN